MNTDKIIKVLKKYLPKEALKEVATLFFEELEKANDALERHYNRKLQLMKLRYLKKKQP